MTQFSLLSLVPGLLRALEDCADPELDYYEQRLVKPTSVRTSDRKSCMSIYGPLKRPSQLTSYSAGIYGHALAIVREREFVWAIYPSAAT